MFGINHSQNTAQILGITPHYLCLLSSFSLAHLLCGGRGYYLDSQRWCPGIGKDCTPSRVLWNKVWANPAKAEWAEKNFVPNFFAFFFLAQSVEKFGKQGSKWPKIAFLGGGFWYFLFISGWKVPSSRIWACLPVFGEPAGRTPPPASIFDPALFPTIEPPGVPKKTLASLCILACLCVHVSACMLPLQSIKSDRREPKRWQKRWKPTPPSATSIWAVCREFPCVALWFSPLLLVKGKYHPFLRHFCDSWFFIILRNLIHISIVLIHFFCFFMWYLLQGVG